MMDSVKYSVSSGNTVYEIYTSEGSDRQNVRTRNIRSGKTKFVRGYRTYGEARFYVDAMSKPKRELV